MARKLTLQEELEALEEIKKLLEEVDCPTTSHELSNICKYSGDVIERITCKYNLEDVLHGEAAIAFNRKISRARINEKHFEYVYNKYSQTVKQMYAENKSSEDIKSATKLSLQDIRAICTKLGISFEELKEKTTALKIARNKQKLFEARKLQIESIIYELKKENTPITVKQIQRKKFFLETDILEVLKNCPEAIIGDAAITIDKQLRSTRCSEASRRTAKQKLETLKINNVSKYGVPYYFQTQAFIDKSAQTRLEKYGDKNFNNRAKAVETCLSRYGVKNVQQNPAIKEKTRQTCLKKYGVDNPSKSKDVLNTIIETTESKYGVKYPCLTPACLNNNRACYIFNNNTFDSEWELCYYIYMRDNGFTIKRYSGEGFEYLVNGNLHRYYPDFEIENTLIEIKGSHFFDSEGTLYNPFTKDEETQLVWKKKHELMKSMNIEIVSDCDKYIRYVNEKYTSNFTTLFKKNIPFPYPNQALKLTDDYNIIRHFHKSIWSANVKDHLSPLEAWEDKDLIYRSAINRLKYVYKCSPKDIVQGFNIAKIAPKVSVFRPSLADRLIKNYLSQYKTIFDPFSGFSGRLIGAVKNNKNYIGHDIDEIHINESKNLLSYLKQHNKCGSIVSLSVEDALTAGKQSYDCLFTCPPYSDKEHWGSETSIHTAEYWIEHCLKTFLCNKYVFVVDDPGKYSSYTVETLTNSSHLSTSYEYVVVIDKEDIQ